MIIIIMLLVMVVRNFEDTLFFNLMTDKREQSYNVYDKKDCELQQLQILNLN